MLSAPPKLGTFSKHHIRCQQHWGNASVSFPSALQDSIIPIGIAPWEFSLKSWTFLMQAQEIWMNKFKKRMTAKNTTKCWRMLLGTTISRKWSSTVNWPQDIFFKNIFGMWQCFMHGQKCTRENKKSLCSPLSAVDVEAGKLFQP